MPSYCTDKLCTHRSTSRSCLHHRPLPPCTRLSRVPGRVHGVQHPLLRGGLQRARVVQQRRAHEPRQRAQQRLRGRLALALAVLQQRKRGRQRVLEHQRRLGGPQRHRQRLQPLHQQRLAAQVAVGHAVRKVLHQQRGVHACQQLVRRAHCRHAHLVVGGAQRARQCGDERVEAGRHALVQARKQGAQHLARRHAHLGVAVSQARRHAIQ
mmetsp:Transcript_15449/g.38469  ORF Transcript_15449/g.38469 Transcript_15449/m.38469 type:complete len:210 (-) Transcript_15449:2807-3436(-)